MTGWIPDAVDMIYYIDMKFIDKEYKDMEHTDSKTLLKAIKIFKERYGILEPLNTEGIEKILKELKEKK